MTGPAVPAGATRATAGLPPADDAIRRYRRVVAVTVAAVYVLILVGASVRASGAGMGCPDWPTCFGRWIPPVSEAQLPADYQRIYADRGYRDTRFNAVKTWTEFGNRLMGVLVGLLIMLTAALSWPCRRRDPRIVVASVAAFLMVGLQGWLGAQVVASNLLPGMITVHMLMALAIVGTLLYGVARSGRAVAPKVAAPVAARPFGPWLVAVIALTVIQVGLGTQVREMTDVISRTQGEGARASWIAAMPWFFYVHRSFSAIVLLANLWLLRLLLVAAGWRHRLTRLAVAAVAVIALTVLSGVALNHFGMPMVAQPAHLLGASLLFGLQFLTWMEYRYHKERA